jgi:MFS family permease
MSKFAIDLTPLKKYRELRLLFTSGLITRLGSMVTYVALPFQIKELTNSYVAVGLMGAAQIIPLIVFSLYGGVLADSLDRKKMIFITEFGSLGLSALLLINSLLHKPHLILLYVIAAGFTSLDGLQTPSLSAIVPRIVDHQDMPSTTALMGIRWQVGAVVAPAIGGVMISTLGVESAYIMDVITYVLSLALIFKMKPVPPSEKATPASLSSLIDGVKYAVSRKDLLGTYIVDFAAMFFAMPNALFPFWADHIHARWALGLFYSAGMVGAIVVTLTSGWMKNYPFHGRAVTFAALGWAIAIALSAATNNLWVVLFFLATAGASDQISAMMRGNIWNQSIADEFRGRLAGIELLSYAVGPMAGQLRAGTMAALTTLRISVAGGGLICTGFVTIAAKIMPDFWRYDVRTNRFAVEKRDRTGDLNN